MSGRAGGGCKARSRECEPWHIAATGEEWGGGRRCMADLCALSGARIGAEAEGASEPLSGLLGLWGRRRQHVKAPEGVSSRSRPALLVSSGGCELRAAGCEMEAREAAAEVGPVQALAFERSERIRRAAEEERGGADDREARVGATYDEDKQLDGSGAALQQRPRFWGDFPLGGHKRQDGGSVAAVPHALHGLPRRGQAVGRTAVAVRTCEVPSGQHVRGEGRSWAQG